MSKTRQKIESAFSEGRRFAREYKDNGFDLEYIRKNINSHNPYNKKHNANVAFFKGFMREYTGDTDFKIESLFNNSYFEDKKTYKQIISEVEYLLPQNIPILKFVKLSKGYIELPISMINFKNPELLFLFSF